MKRGYKKGVFMSKQEPLRPVWKAGYVERDALLPNGLTIHYAAGPDNGLMPLLLIHGQTGAWQSYAAVLPELAQHYRVFAVDCPGHGQSSRLNGPYTAASIGADLLWFIEHICGGPAIVSGHSSGGLLSAWLAANGPHLVRGALLEDPPFFSTIPGGRWESSFAYIDTYRTIHDFLNQSEESDWVVYYLNHAGWTRFLPPEAQQKMVEYGTKYRRDHPGKPLEYWFLPDSINRMFRWMDAYDLRFGDAFFDHSWFDGFEQETTLRRIACPTVLIHTKWTIQEDGVLMAAMSGEDAEKVVSLIPHCELFYIDSGHEAHYEKPTEFLEAAARLRALMGER